MHIFDINTYHEFIDMISAWKSRLYPGFVYGGSVDSLPVFVYHQIDSKLFESHLIHLRQNGYETARANAFVNYKTYRKNNSHTVVLTFDDGLNDLYEVAYPLLKKFDFQAVAYIVPKWVGKPKNVNWNQLREMYESGTLDIQSHSLSHRTIIVSSKIKGIYNSSMNGDPKIQKKIPVIEEGNIKRTLSLKSGYPLFENASRFADLCAYWPPKKLFSEIDSILKNVSGKSNQRVINQIRQLNSRLNLLESGHCETTEEQLNEIRFELEESKRQIESHLRGHLVEHFAYPWFQYGNVTEQLLPGLGYKSSVIGLKGGRLKLDNESSPWLIGRVNADFIHTLPGDGRENFFSVTRRKIKRRLKRR